MGTRSPPQAVQNLPLSKILPQTLHTSLPEVSVLAGSGAEIGAVGVLGRGADTGVGITEATGAAGVGIAEVVLDGALAETS